MANPATDIPPPRETGGPEPGLIEDAKVLWLELVALLHDRLQLAALETKHAGESLVAMIATGVLVAVLLVSAWLGLLGAIILWLIHMGLMASIAMLLGVLINLVLAVILYRSIHRQKRNLGWPATLRSLQQLAADKDTDHGSQ